MGHPVCTPPHTVMGSSSIVRPETNLNSVYPCFLETEHKDRLRVVLQYGERANELPFAAFVVCARISKAMHIRAWGWA